MLLNVVLLVVEIVVVVIVVVVGCGDDGEYCRGGFYGDDDCGIGLCGGGLGGEREGDSNVVVPDLTMFWNYSL